MESFLSAGAGGIHSKRTKLLFAGGGGRVPRDMAVHVRVAAAREQVVSVKVDTGHAAVEVLDARDLLERAEVPQPRRLVHLRDRRPPMTPSVSHTRGVLLTVSSSKK